MIAIAPTATIASIAGCYECVEPQVSNLFKRETCPATSCRSNRYLVGERAARPGGRRKCAMRSSWPTARSVASCRFLEALRTVYRTVWSCRCAQADRHAAARGAFIDQSASPQPVHAEPEHRACRPGTCGGSATGTRYYLRCARRRRSPRPPCPATPRRRRWPAQLKPAAREACCNASPRQRC